MIVGRLIPAGTGLTKNILDNQAKEEDKIRIAELQKQELAKQDLEKTQKTESNVLIESGYILSLISGKCLSNTLKVSRKLFGISLSRLM